EIPLIEEIVGRLRAGQHEEGGGVPEAGVLAGERLEDADAALRIDHPVVALLDEAELARGRVVEGEDHRAGARGQGDLAVEIVGERDRPVAPVPEALEVLPEVLGGAGPALLGVVDLVVLEDHHPAQLVGGQRGCLRGRERGGAEADREQPDRDGGPHGYWVTLVRAAVLGAGPPRCSRYAGSTASSLSCRRRPRRGSGR